jgi:hypothetical protein
MIGNFIFNNRNPGHWDVYDNARRIFCIRGEPGNVTIRDERNGAGAPNIGPFKTDLAAASWIIDNLMFDHSALTPDKEAEGE